MSLTPQEAPIRISPQLHVGSASVDIRDIIKRLGDEIIDDRTITAILLNLGVQEEDVEVFFMFDFMVLLTFFAETDPGRQRVLSMRSPEDVVRVARQPVGSGQPHIQPIVSRTRWEEMQNENRAAVLDGETRQPFALWFLLEQFVTADEDTAS